MCAYVPPGYSGHVRSYGRAPRNSRHSFCVRFRPAIRHAIDAQSAGSKSQIRSLPGLPTDVPDARREPPGPSVSRMPASPGTRTGLPMRWFVVASHRSTLDVMVAAFWPRSNDPSSVTSHWPRLTSASDVSCGYGTVKDARSVPVSTSQKPTVALAEKLSLPRMTVLSSAVKTAALKVAGPLGRTWSTRASGTDTSDVTATVWRAFDGTRAMVRPSGLNWAYGSALYRVSLAL